MKAIITENDESKWEDVTGTYCHFPHKYVNILTQGTEVIYYKGKLKNSKYKEFRLSPQPHYFGFGLIGVVEPVKIKVDYKAKI